MDTKSVILMIDDDSMMLQKAYQILENKYDVRQAKSAKQGMRLLEKRKPDLILLDITMPEMDGYEALVEIRKIEACEHIPVIFLTSLEDAESEIKGLELGAVDFIRKPFIPEILLSRVSRHMEEGLKTRNLSKLSERKPVLEFDPDKVADMKKVLTSTEYQVAELVAMGFDNQEISDKLQLSYSYTKQVVSKVFSKLDISKRSGVKQFFVKD